MVFQTTGKAEYINDTPAQQHELHAAFVISTVGNAKIQSMDLITSTIVFTIGQNMGEIVPGNCRKHHDTSNMIPL